jgi:hypothetical protein
MKTSQFGRQLGERDLRSVICKDGPCVLWSKELMLNKRMYVQSHKQCNFEATHAEHSTKLDTMAITHSQTVHDHFHADICIIFNSKDFY